MMILRPEWELPGMTVDDHSSSPPVDWTKITHVDIHYPGGGTWPVNPSRDWVIGYIRSMQTSYVRTRGYSVGYNELASQNGIGCEVRGSDFRCAANGVTEANKTGYAIQIISNIGSLAEALAIDHVNERIACAELLAGRDLVINGHRDHKPTGCPGDPIYGQIQAGVFYGEPDPQPPPPPPPPPVDADDEGIYYVQPGDSPWRVSEFAYGTGTRWEEIVKANVDDPHMDPGDLFAVPGIKGSAIIAAPGDGAYSLIRKGGQEPNAITLDRYYGWNGGKSRTVHPGDVVFVEDV